MTKSSGGTLALPPPPEPVFGACGASAVFAPATSPEPGELAPAAVVAGAGVLVGESVALAVAVVGTAVVVLVGVLVAVFVGVLVTVATGVVAMVVTVNTGGTYGAVVVVAGAVLVAGGTVLVAGGTVLVTGGGVPVAGGLVAVAVVVPVPNGGGVAVPVAVPVGGGGC